MRYINILLQKIRFAGLILLCLMLAGPGYAQAQKEKKVRQSVDVTLKVTDEDGNPIPKAQVVVGEGVIHTQTDENGAVSFKGYPDDFVTVSSSAFEKKVLLVLDIINESSVKLVKSKLFATSSDNVELPFTTIKKRHMTGSTTIIDGKRLEMYPSTDLRNAITGLATGVDVREIYGNPGITPQEYINFNSFGATEKIGITSRGRSLMVMIDNVPTDITEMPLDPGEIESISIIKDITTKAMFGPAAAEGVIFIRTKRGYANEHALNVNVEQGVSTIDRFPGYVSGSEYADLNNQARINDGETPNYSAADIAAYANNDPYDLYHPSINFRELMLKNTRSFTRANVSSSGGNDIVQYHSYLGYNGEGDIYKIGEKADYNRISTRSNIDIKLNEFLKLKFDFYGNMSIRRSPNYGYDPQYTSEGTDNPALTLLEFPSVLRDINTIPPIAFPLHAAYDDISNVPWYGVSQAFPTSQPNGIISHNPVGGLENQGYYTETGRNGAANIALDYDMGGILDGLTSKTFVGFNLFNLVRIGKAEDYIAYFANPSVSAATGNDTILLSRSHLGFDMANQIKLMDYYFQRFSIYENLNYEKTFTNSALRSSLTYYLGSTFKNGIEEPQRQQNAVFTTSYTYNDKYTILGVLNYAGTHSFAKDKRYALFPSVGASWIISEESFMSGLTFLNFLKLRAQAGILGNEIDLPPFYYVDRWNINTSGTTFGPYSSNQWFGSTGDGSVPRSYLQRTGNPDLTWETAKEFSLGFDALLMNEKLSLEVTYYNNVRDGQIVQVINNLPYLAGLSGARPVYNYNKTKYYGLETGLQYSERSGDLFYSIGVSGVIQNSERLKYDQPNYRNEYQNRVGKPTDAIFGQTYLGKFTSDAEALVVPQRFDDVLHTGDLKYKDLNGDGIVDDNDQSQIGHAAPRLYYSLNARVAYKNFELALIGTGKAFYQVGLTNEYFWNGWGDDTYSNFVRDNIGGDYPRLTYYKVNNNFLTSDFWLRDGGYFKLQNVELAYNLPSKITGVIGGRLIRLYVRGANVLTLSKIKDVDPESLSSGVTGYPLYKTFTGGIKFNF